jgi:thiol:disulfide interchange protein DsbG
MNTRFLTIATVIAALAVSACGNTSQAQSSAEPTYTQAKVTKQEFYEKTTKNPGGFSVGPSMAATVAYVYFDPQCPHCARLWQAAEPLKSSVRFVWLPIGMLSRASAPQGATILGAKEPAAAMTENEQLILSRTGGITANSDAVSRFSGQVQGNTNLFNGFRGPDDGVPFIITKVGSEIRTNPGEMTTEALKLFLGVGNH